MWSAASCLGRSEWRMTFGASATFKRVRSWLRTPWKAIFGSIIKGYNTHTHTCMRLGASSMACICQCTHTYTAVPQARLVLILSILIVLWQSARMELNTHTCLYKTTLRPARYKAGFIAKAFEQPTSHEAETENYIHIHGICEQHSMLLACGQSGCQGDIYIGLGLSSINLHVNALIVPALRVIIGGMCMWMTQLRTHWTKAESE